FSVEISVYQLPVVPQLSLYCIMITITPVAVPNPATPSLTWIAGFMRLSSSHNIPLTRRKRYISQNDMLAILDYHNKVRGKVFPPASNMEYMVSDLHLQLYQYIPMCSKMLMKPWHDEVKDYVFPYPQDCNPRCPLKCYGPMCTHYTQMVWATTNKVGCAVHTCHNMNVWGNVWKRATFLVCNYSSKGNWIGEAPYKVGVPCSACPPSYGGSCSNDMCFPALNTNYLQWFK
uniref:Peptidase inhibitor 15 n=1 Tax=Hucho hucho TaxID=62062 RepID=A0A4W5Q8Q5_9TELE